ncbi:hypothetical protein VTK56DRAFT_389 [Thermocarpiscus australiensis]
MTSLLTRRLEVVFYRPDGHIKTVNHINARSERVGTGAALRECKTRLGPLLLNSTNWLDRVPRLGAVS